MTATIRESLAALADAFDVDLGDLTDDDLDAVAIRMIATEQRAPTKKWLQRIVDDAKRGGSTRQVDRGEHSAVESPVSWKDGIRWSGTGASEAKMRERLAKSHRTEDNRTGLYLVPPSPPPMRPDAVHPACLAAYMESANPCVRCIPLLHPGACDCDVCSEWWAAVD